MPARLGRAREQEAEGGPYAFPNTVNSVIPSAEPAMWGHSVDDVPRDVERRGLGLTRPAFVTRPQVTLDAGRLLGLDREVLEAGVGVGEVRRLSPPELPSRYRRHYPVALVEP
jgi:hypothetical protein